jgi:hypothetical protein
MAKQVVIETRSGKAKTDFLGFDEYGEKIFRTSLLGPDVKIETSYVFDADLIGKKEREEVVIGNITKYWVYVPEEIQGVYQTWEDKQDIITNRRKIKAEKKQEIWSKLQQEKNDRIERYAKMVLKGELFTGELQPTDEDLESARKLQSVSLRAQNKKMCKIG